MEAEMDDKDEVSSPSILLACTKVNERFEIILFCHSRRSFAPSSLPFALPFVALASTRHYINYTLLAANMTTSILAPSKTSNRHYSQLYTSSGKYGHYHPHPSLSHTVCIVFALILKKVVEEMDVYLSKAFAQSLYMVQLPLKPKERSNEVPQSAQIKVFFWWGGDGACICALPVFPAVVFFVQLAFE
jgi:hypothetical protein